MKQIKIDIPIRFGYCPPNPGPKSKINNKWYTDVKSAIENWKGEPIWVKINGIYRQINIDELYDKL